MNFTDDLETIEKPTNNTIEQTLPPVPPTKAKRVMSQAQKDALAKGRMKKKSLSVVIPFDDPVPIVVPAPIVVVPVVSIRPVIKRPRIIKPSTQPQMIEKPVPVQVPIKSLRSYRTIYD